MAGIAMQSSSIGANCMDRKEFVFELKETETRDEWLMLVCVGDACMYE
jgi:hypothetical protein